jgi:hypothetical protein
VNAALAARCRQLEAQREHARAVAEFRRHREQDSQDRIRALLDELICALAQLPLGDGSWSNQYTATGGKSRLTARGEAA